jgi:hypothetical protein
MKNILFLLFLLTTVAFCENVKMIKAIEKNLAILDTAKTYETAILLKNNFERIAEAELGEWIPQYYAAMSNATISMKEKDPKIKEEIVDRAEMYANRADSLQPENSEIFVIKSMIVYARITVSPMERYMALTPEANKFIDKATEFDPENPRIFLQKALTTMFTPEMMGGGKAKSRPLFLTAKEKFKSFVPKSSIHPNWGESLVDEMMKRLDEKK